MGNFNYHFGEKGHRLPRKFWKHVEALCRRWRKQLAGEEMCCLITTTTKDLAENVDMAGIIRMTMGSHF